jgi:hypothetical protein
LARYLGLGSDEPIEESEQLVAKALRQLSDDWIIIHHVNWQSARYGRQGDGEADFLLLHHQKGIIVLEVKGGGIDVKEGRWVSTDRYGRKHDIKNPYEQATTSKHALVTWLKQEGWSEKVRVGHAVVFPHLDMLPALGLVMNPSITMAGCDLSCIEASVNRCATHWDLTSKIAKRELDELVSDLAPTVSVKRKHLLHQSREVESNIILLTAEQISLFSGLRASRGGLILGSAGTGKTILAAARAQQLAKDGFRTLLVCFNELLAADIAARLQGIEKITVSTFHSLCMKEIRLAKLSVPKELSNTWWNEEGPNLLLEAASKNKTQYDAVVVDEGQDFSPLWLESLHYLTTLGDETPFFIFADPRQELWNRDWAQSQAQFDFSWELSKNLRNSDPIAEKVANLYMTPIQTRHLDGPKPVWRDLTDERAASSDVIAVVEKLLNEGFSHSSITVLCQDGSLVEDLRERLIGPFSFGKWGGNGIAVETIGRFKGMESEAVVLVINQGISEADRMAAYVGISRARSVLMLIAPPKMKPFLNWLIKADQ